MLANQLRNNSNRMSPSPPTKAQEVLHTELCAWLSDIAENRSKHAFSLLFKWFAPRIKQFGLKQFNNEAQALELVQETMTNVWRKSHMYHRDRGAPTTWLYSIMRNMSFDMLRKIQTQREDTMSDDIWPLEQTQVDNEFDGFFDHLQSQTLAKHVNGLPDNQKQVVTGIYFQQLTQEQLAQQLNLPLGTVKSRLRLALSKLRQLMGESHD